ncbi:MAG TPA: hypothetical protein VNW94_18520 [Streptosporangiaceae bacterium]|jgi:hypothetical protein|nr:hypothetical protein [Streptosporangiaceae bacterium]
MPDTHSPAQDISYITDVNTICRDAEAQHHQVNVLERRVRRMEARVAEPASTSVALQAAIPMLVCAGELIRAVAQMLNGTSRDVEAAARSGGVDLGCGSGPEAGCSE